MRKISMMLVALLILGGTINVEAKTTKKSGVKAKKVSAVSDAKPFQGVFKCKFANLNREISMNLYKKNSDGNYGTFTYDLDSGDMEFIIVDAKINEIPNTATMYLKEKYSSDYGVLEVGLYYVPETRSLILSYGSLKYPARFFYDELELKRVK